MVVYNAILCYPTHTTCLYENLNNVPNGKVRPTETADNMREASAEMMTSTHSRMPYLAGIDGLRAIAVLAVMLYHAEVPWMPGGFLGVEVFFGISGYLITGLLFAEWREKGSINFGRFWFRRARRLLPAVFVLLLAVLLYAVLFLPAEVASLRNDALAAAAYVSNWYQVFSHKSYFEAIGRPPLLRHLWSLAVEEQFYLVWPLLLAGILRVIHPRRSGFISIPVAGLAILSTALMFVMYQPDADPSRIYYGTDTRAAGFLIGAALALLLANGLPSISKKISLLLDVVGALGLIGLILCFIKLDEINPYLYQGGFTFISLLTVAVIASVAVAGSRVVPHVLGNKFLVYIGLRSYSIYLWHWPIFDVTRPHMDVQLDGVPLLLVRFILTLVAAELSYRFIERPIREGVLGRVWTQFRSTRSWKHALPLTAVALLSVVLVMVLGRTIVNAKPAEIPQEYVEIQPTPAADVSAPGQPIAEQQVAPTALATQQVPTSTPYPISLAVMTAVTQSSIAQYKPPWPYSLVDTTTTVALQATRMDVGSSGVSTAISQTSTATAATRAVEVTRAPMTLTRTVTDLFGINYHILAIGDSVMLGAAQELQQEFGGAEVDAAVSRQAVAAIALLNQRRDAGTLGDIVVLHIGSNGFVTPKQFDDMMGLLTNVRIVVVVNVRVPRRWEGPNNNLFSEHIKLIPNAVLVDWYNTSDTHPELFVDDGVHLQPLGKRLYAQAIVAQTIAFDVLLRRTQATDKTAR